jgi:hypothetical protein
MPIGLESPLVGMTIFAGIKMAGYSTFIRYRLKDEDVSSPRNFLTIGAVRTAIGVVVGIVYGIGFATLVDEIGLSTHTWAFLPFVFYAGLFPIRLLEWEIILRLFFREIKQDRPLARRMRLAGTGWSYVLDVPAMVGLFTTGGAWVC